MLRIGVRAQDHKSGATVDQHLLVSVELGGAKTDHHRDAPRSGENGDMAAGAAASQSQSASGAPIRLQEHGGRHIFGSEHGAIRLDPAARGAREMPEDAVAEVPQIAGSRAEVIVLRRFVIGDLDGKRRRPRRLRGRTFGDRHQGRRPQAVVPQHRDLESQHLDAVGILGARPKRLEVVDGSADRALECEALGRLVARRDPLPGCGVEPHEAPEGQAWRCRFSSQLTRRRHQEHPR